MARVCLIMRKFSFTNCDFATNLNVRNYNETTCVGTENARLHVTRCILYN